MKRILVAGIGNIFLGDDAFGCEAVRLLLQEKLPEGVSVVDFGIRSYDLVYAIMDGFNKVILVDAVQRGQAPGTLFLVEPDLSAHDPQRQIMGGHNMDLVNTLKTVHMLGGTSAGLLLVGCEPATFLNNVGEISLSEPVRAALPKALEMIHSLVDKILAENSVAESTSRNS